MIHRRDAAVVAALVVVLVVLVGAVALPTPVAPGATDATTPPPSVAPAAYREGIVGRPVSITPLTARNRVDQSLVGLVFSGLVRPTEDGGVEPDLAASWSVSDDGSEWTFRIRDDATWHDGMPVTAADVVFTVDSLHDPELARSTGTSWAEVRATAIDDRTVRFTLASPLAGFLAAASQPLVPAHLLADVPPAELADDPFATAPVGTGPYELVSLDEDRAVLTAAALRPATPIVRPGDPSETDSVATPAPTPLPERAVPYITRLEFRFFDDADALEAAFREGELEAAGGLPPAEAGTLAETVIGARLLRYPTTTLAAVLLDQHTTHGELRDARVRRALLAVLDRDALITGPLGGAGLRADAPIPPAAWAFDPASATRIKHDLKAATALLREAGWTKGEKGWLAPRAKQPYALEILAPSASANPTVRGLADGVAEAWRTFGLTVTVAELEPAALAKRLREGEFAATVVDVRIGADLDLFPLLASSQTRSGGGNVAGVQDAVLDRLLAAARKPGTDEERRTAYRELLAHLSVQQPLLPLAWRDETVVVRGVEGPAPVLIADPGDRFGDVLTWRLAAGR